MALTKKGFRRLNRLRRLIQLKSLKTVEDLANLGKYRAKEIAPYQTGRVAKMIRKRVNNNQMTATIISANPSNHYWNEKSLVKKNHGGSVVKFIHSPDFMQTKGHNWSEYNYMEKTKIYLNSKKMMVAKGNFKGIKL